MNAFGRFLVAFLLLANLCLLAALSMHVVRTPGRVGLVAKSQLTLVETVVDTRGWTANDLRVHAPVVTRIVQAGKADLLSHVTDATAGAYLQQPDRDVTQGLAVPSQLLKAEPAEPRQKTVFDFPDAKK